MAITTYPGDSNTFAATFPYVARDDGILHDLTGGAFRVTPSGSSTSVAVDPGVISVAGFAAVLDAATALDLTSVGVEPTSGQKRVDRIAAVYDWSRASSDPDTAVQIEIIPGTPVPTSSSDLAARPALPRVIGTRYAVPLWWVSRPADGIVTAHGSERAWTGPAQLVSNDFDTSLSAPLGTTIRDPQGTAYIRAWAPTGDGTTPEWYRIGGRESVYARKPWPAVDRPYDLFAADTWSLMINVSAYLPPGTYQAIAELSVSSADAPEIGGVGTPTRFTTRWSTSGLEGEANHEVFGSVTGVNRVMHFDHGGGAVNVYIDGNMRGRVGYIWAGSSISLRRIGY